MMLLAGHGLDVVADIVADAWRRSDRIQIVLVVWLLIGAASATYALLTPKVLLVSAPAMAILLARRTTLKERRQWLSKPLAGVVITGVVIGLLILRADSALAEIGREGGRVVATQKSEGRTVWMDGSWGFQWYAMQAGAEPLAGTGPMPNPGDVIVAGPWARFVRKNVRNMSLIYRRTFAEPGGRVIWDGAGFFSNFAGPLPWVWADDELGRIEVWRIDSPAADSR
jgi:hypothetical protein